MSNEARHRDIAALLARGVVPVKKPPLVAKAIESQMPDGTAHPTNQPSQAESTQANEERAMKWLIQWHHFRMEVINEPKRIARDCRIARRDGQILQPQAAQSGSGCPAGHGSAATPLHQPSGAACGWNPDQRPASREP